MTEDASWWRSFLYDIGGPGLVGAEGGGRRKGSRITTTEEIGSV